MYNIKKPIAIEAVGFLNEKGMLKWWVDQLLLLVFWINTLLLLAK